MSDITRTDDEREPIGGGRRTDERLCPALAIVYASEPGRTGEVFVVTGDDHVLGRGDANADDPAPRLLPMRQRPGIDEARPPIESPFLSRVQLRVRKTGDRALRIENVGKSKMRDGRGAEVEATTLVIGDTFTIGKHFLFVCVERPIKMARPRSIAAVTVPFGDADEHGIVGESVAAWKLRDAIAFLGARSAHVLVLGPSGTGKEIATRAIHSASDRRGRRLVARNAATIPATLVEAELFGNAANYPNAGMTERPGLVGEADGSILFLDEIGELPEELQAKLLRLLDGDGDYQRLGDARRRRADLRVVAATNRGVDTLRPDVAARLKLRLTLPGLDERREDIPLLAKHLLRVIAKDDPDVARWFLADGEPRMTLALVKALVMHTYQTHVRELESLLWVAISTSTGDALDLTPEVEEELGAREPPPPASFRAAVTEAAVREALERANGVREKAWRDLGLANRYVLKRLMKKYGIGED